MYAEKVITLSHKGIFYCAYDTDAIILHNIFGYKLTSGNHLSCGFPEGTLGKVTVKLSNLRISYRVYKATKDNPVNIVKEELFQNSINYEKFSVRSDFSEAYDFLCRICEQYQGKSPVSGMKLVIDPADEDVFRYFLMIKKKLEEKGANYE